MSDHWGIVPKWIECSARNVESTGLSHYLCSHCLRTVSKSFMQTCTAPSMFHRLHLWTLEGRQFQIQLHFIELHYASHFSRAVAQVPQFVSFTVSQVAEVCIIRQQFHATDEFLLEVALYKCQIAVTVTILQIIGYQWTRLSSVYHSGAKVRSTTSSC